MKDLEDARVSSLKKFVRDALVIYVSPGVYFTSVLVIWCDVMVCHFGVGLCVRFLSARKVEAMCDVLLGLC